MGFSPKCFLNVFYDFAVGAPISTPMRRHDVSICVHGIDAKRFFFHKDKTRFSIGGSVLVFRKRP